MKLWKFFDWILFIKRNGDKCFMYFQIVLSGCLFLFIVAGCILNKEKIDNPSIKEYSIIFTVFTIILFVFMWKTGVLNSGYHFVDDHEVYVIGRDFSKFGFWKTMHKWLLNDMHIRFRFTYQLLRVIECFLVGDNFFVWHILQTFISVLSLFLSYVFARKMQCTVWMAYIFSTIIFIGGGQSDVFWRLGPQENWGILILMLTLICLYKYAEVDKVGNLVKTILMTILLGGIKESFLLILPLLPIWFVYWQIRKRNETISFHNISILVKKHWIYFLLTYLIFIIDIIIIFLYTGVNEIGYAGIDTTYGLKDYIRGLYFVLSGSLFPYIKVTVVGGIFLLIPVGVLSFKEEGKFHLFFNQMIIPVLSFVYFLGVQFILHTKSGMYERYLLPTTFIIAFFWVIDIFFVLKQRNNSYFCGYYSMFILLMGLLLYGSTNDEERAINYAKDGKNSTAMLEAVAEYTYENGDINIVTGMDYEMDLSACIYLQEKYNIKTVYTLFYKESENGIINDGYICGSDEKQYITIDEVQMFIGYPDQITEFILKHGMEVEKFNRLHYGDYVIFSKDNIYV